MWRPALIRITIPSFISSISRDGTYVTYNTTSAHGLSANSKVTITGATSAAFNLKDVLVYDAPTTTSFRVASTVTGSTSTANLAFDLSDHSRADVRESYEQIEKSQRTANGTTRKYVINSKRSWALSWTMLPGMSSQTIDGYAGAADLKAIYDIAYDMAITLSFYVGDNSSPTKAKGRNPDPLYSTTVFISDFSRTIKKRLGDYDYWDCSINFVEA